MKSYYEWKQKRHKRDKKGYLYICSILAFEGGISETDYHIVALGYEIVGPEYPYTSYTTYDFLSFCTVIRHSNNLIRAKMKLGISHRLAKQCLLLVVRNLIAVEQNAEAEQKGAHALHDQLQFITLRSRYLWYELRTDVKGVNKNPPVSPRYILPYTHWISCLILCFTLA